jgi:hypothetical protein
MVGIDAIADAAFDLDADNKRRQEVAAADRPIFRHGKDRRCDRAGGMDDRLQMGVVIVEHMRGNAVDQRGVEFVEPLGAADHLRAFGAGKHAHGVERPVDGFVACAADGAAEPVDEGPDTLGANIGGNLVSAEIHDPVGQSLGDRGVVHRLDFFRLARMRWIQSRASFNGAKGFKEVAVGFIPTAGGSKCPARHRRYSRPVQAAEIRRAVKPSSEARPSRPRTSSTISFALPRAMPANSAFSRNLSATSS